MLQNCLQGRLDEQGLLQGLKQLLLIDFVVVRHVSALVKNVNEPSNALPRGAAAARANVRRGGHRCPGATAARWMCSYAAAQHALTLSAIPTARALRTVGCSLNPVTSQTHQSTLSTGTLVRVPCHAVDVLGIPQLSAMVVG